MLAIAGKEHYVVCAADTRMSTGYNILTRDYKKIMNERQVRDGVRGFSSPDGDPEEDPQGPMLKSYEFQNDKEMGCVSFAQMLSNTLYYRRFFPYYTFNIVAGLDAEGKGAVFYGSGILRRTSYCVPGRRTGTHHARAR